jgi:hypothetical protein
VPNGAKVKRWRSQMERRRSQMERRRTQLERRRAKDGAKMEPKGAKREPRATKMHIKIDLRKGSRKASQKGHGKEHEYCDVDDFLASNPKKWHIKSIQKSIAKNMENEAKRLPKWSRNRCRKSLKINAKTGIEKYYKNHENSCFSERVKP